MAMKPVYLAIDIGASSGRHIAGWIENNQIHIEEVYRFPNSPVFKNNQLIWDHKQLFEQIVKGLALCPQKGFLPESIGIDTWAVDFALLDENGLLVEPIVSYRDKRTENLRHMADEAYLYGRTGIQYQPFNTLYQLLAVKRDHPDNLLKAKHMLLMPEYFNYLLTGKMISEYTNATTTGLVNAETRNWDFEIINSLNLPQHLFFPLAKPGLIVGCLKKELEKQIGYNASVILPPTHDTACAVAAAPIGEESLYLSSGTWSLMGVENAFPITHEKSRICNFTNEGGVNNSYRYLKNIMGLWILQCLQKESDSVFKPQTMSELAQKATPSCARIDINDESFLAPQHMGLAVEKYLKSTNQPIPKDEPSLWRLVFDSLADCYAKAVKEIESLTQKQYRHIAIVGGGCQNQLLNQLTANACNKTVTAGPVEATAFGNLLCQMVASKEIPSFDEGRQLISQSFKVKTYHPQ